MLKCPTARFVPNFGRPDAKSGLQHISRQIACQVHLNDRVATDVAVVVPVVVCSARAPVRPHSGFDRLVVVALARFRSARRCCCCCCCRSHVCTHCPIRCTSSQCPLAKRRPTKLLALHLLLRPALLAPLPCIPHAGPNTRHRRKLNHQRMHSLSGRTAAPAHFRRCARHPNIHTLAVALRHRTTGLLRRHRRCRHRRC